MCLCASAVAPSLAQKSEAPSLFPVRQDGKWGYINAAGERVIAPQFDTALSFNGGLAKVYLKGKHGYIDKTGKFIWEPSK